MWPYEPRIHRRRGLRYWVLSMLASSPKNGAEIMNEIEGMSQGWWRPSPGSIYPLLEELAQDGFIRKRADGRYELTQKRMEEVGWPFGVTGRRPITVEGVLNEMTGYLSYIEDLSTSDKSKVAPYMDRIRGIADRLMALAK
jgi:DNA-binding PadR family transcriptional regulator